MKVAPPPGHLLATAARATRQVLVDHARAEGPTAEAERELLAAYHDLVKDRGEKARRYRELAGSR